MAKRFSEKDLGSRIELEFDPLKVDEQFYVSEPGYVKVPYDAIEKYSFLVKAKESSLPRIMVISPKLPEVNTIHIAKVLGASSITIDGVIMELADTYVKIQKSPRSSRIF